MPQPTRRKGTVPRVSEPKHKYTFPIPIPLYERLRESAEHSRRAIYAELTVILEQHFAAEDAAKTHVA